MLKNILNETFQMSWEGFESARVELETIESTF